jgi:glycosyltransferase involved in cell wall biosynthesis
VSRIRPLIVGPAQHGVVAFATQLAREMSAQDGRFGPAEPVVDVPLAWSEQRLEELARGVDLVHLNYTDALFGPRCDQSAAAFGTLAASFARHGARVSVTLHDVPLASESSEERYRRRSQAYRSVIDATDGRVVVSSTHEADNVRHFAPATVPIVIPLPVPTRTDAARVAAADRDVCVAGFIYPGKGHAEALAAIAGLPAEVGLTALGRPADGHLDYADQLQRTARKLGRRLTITGYLTEEELRRRLRQAAVPLAPQRQISASGSISSWLGAGRRPLVADGPYTRELEGRSPGTLWRYGPTVAGLRGHLLRALAEPAQSWLPAGVVIGPSLAETARRYRHALADFAPLHAMAGRRE